jgi:hypothetical protein
LAIRIAVRDLLLGALAGLIVAPLALLLAYVVGLIAIAVNSGELFATLLAAATVLPLMLLFVLLLPTLAISIVTGLLLGLLSNFIRGWFKTIGCLLGLLVSEICLSLILPMIIVPQADDFMAIVSNNFVSASYGVVIGIIVAWLYRRFR